MAEICQNVFGRQVVLLVVALGVVAELALEYATARGFQQKHLFVRRVENAGEIGRSQSVQIGKRRAECGATCRVVAAVRSGGWNIETRDGNTQHVASDQGEQQFGKSLLSFANGSKVVVRSVQHPSVIRGDLRTTEDDVHVRAELLQLSGDPESALDVPDVTGEAHQPGIGLGQRSNQESIPERV